MSVRARGFLLAALLVVVPGDLAKTASSFWQSYKFMNPVSKTIEPKECERLNDTVVCGGVYQS